MAARSTGPQVRGKRLQQRWEIYQQSESGAIQDQAGIKGSIMRPQVRVEKEVGAPGDRLGNHRAPLILNRPLSKKRNHLPPTGKGGEAGN